MYSTETELTNDILKLQADVLGENIDEDHPYLKKNKSASKSKQFITDRKFVIGAINELVSSQEALSGTTEDALATVYSVLGQIALDQTLKERVLEEAPSLIDLVLQMNQTIEDLKENGGGGSGAGSDVNLYNELKKIGISQYSSNEDVFDVNDEETVSFTLSKENVDPNSIKLYVNGLYYPNNGSSYTYDKTSNELTWTLLDEELGGFNLIGSQIIIMYNYEIDEEE